MDLNWHKAFPLTLRCLRLIKSIQHLLNKWIMAFSHMLNKPNFKKQIMLPVLSTLYKSCYFAYKSCILVSPNLREVSDILVVRTWPKNNPTVSSCRYKKGCEEEIYLLMHKINVVHRISFIISNAFPVLTVITKHLLNMQIWLTSLCKVTLTKTKQDAE